MHEIVVNLHVHTRYSDGTGSHADIVRAALKCGLDAVIATDHNVWIGGMERYVHEDGKKVLLLIGEEIHDRSRMPQYNHLLVLGANQGLASHAEDVERLLEAVRRHGGLSFIAHPIDPAAPAFREPGLSWEDWSVSNFTGIELWNSFSELKTRLHTRLHGIFYAFFPSRVARGPLPEAIKRWDDLLAGRAVVAIGGSDAHALHLRSGALRRTVFPYDHHFRAVNTHVLLRDPLGGNADADARAIYSALAAGRCFIGFDLPRPTRGFRFAAHGPNSEAVMGEQIVARGDVALHARVPDFAEITLVKDGRPVQKVTHGQALTYRVIEPGVFRIEVHRRHLGRRRAWIFSNPIYVR